MYYYVLTSGNYYWDKKKFAEDGFYDFYENPLKFIKHVSTSIFQLLTSNRFNYYDLLEKDREEEEEHMYWKPDTFSCILVFEYDSETDTCKFIAQEIICIEGVKKLYEITKNEEFYELLKIMVEGYENEKFLDRIDIKFPHPYDNGNFNQFPLQENFYICFSYTHTSVTFGKIENLKEIEEKNCATYLFCKDSDYVTKQKHSYMSFPCNGCWIYDDYDDYDENPCNKCDKNSTKEVEYINKIDLNKSFYLNLNGGYRELPNVLDCIYYEGYKTFINRTRNRINKFKNLLNPSLYNSINSIIDNTIIKIEEFHQIDLEKQKKREEERKKEREKKESEHKDKTDEFKKMLEGLK